MEPSSWLPALLSAKFFNSCEQHEGMKKNETNIFCMGCHDSLCQHCLGDHDGHKLLQIRRYVYHDVVRLHDISKLVDCSGVQAYIINSARVVFLNVRPQPRPTKSHNTCRTCSRSLQDDFRFCSLGCKVTAAESRAPSEAILDSAAKRHSRRTARAAVTPPKPEPEPELRWKAGEGSLRPESSSSRQSCGFVEAGLRNAGMLSGRYEADASSDSSANSSDEEDTQFAAQAIYPCDHQRQQPLHHPEQCGGSGMPAAAPKRFRSSRTAAPCTIGSPISVIPEHTSSPDAHSSPRSVIPEQTGSPDALSSPDHVDPDHSNDTHSHSFQGHVIPGHTGNNSDEKDVIVSSACLRNLFQEYREAMMACAASTPPSKRRKSHPQRAPAF